MFYRDFVSEKKTFLSLMKQTKRYLSQSLIHLSTFWWKIIYSVIVKKKDYSPLRFISNFKGLAMGWVGEKIALVVGVILVIRFEVIHRKQRMLF